MNDEYSDIDSCTPIMDDQEERPASKIKTTGKQRLIAKYEPSKQEEIRRANRLAARECRKRKKLLTKNLESTLEAVKNENQILQGQYNALSAMANQLNFQRMSTSTQNQQPLHGQGATSPAQSNPLSVAPITNSPSSASTPAIQTMNQQMQQNTVSQNQGVQQLTPITLFQNSQIFQPMFPFQTQSAAQNPVTQGIMQQTMGMGNADPFFFQQSQLQQQHSANNIYMSLAQIMGQGMNQGISSTGLSNIPIPNSIQMPMQDMNQRVSNLNSPQFTNGDSISFNEKISSNDSVHDGNDTDVKQSAI